MVPDQPAPFRARETSRSAVHTQPRPGYLDRSVVIAAAEAEMTRIRRQDRRRSRVYVALMAGSWLAFWATVIILAVVIA